MGSSAGKAGFFGRLSRMPAREPTLFYSGVTTLIVAAIAIPLGFTLGFFWAWLVAANLSAFGLFAFDKRQASVRGWRVPEWALLWSALILGQVGALLGMLYIRHKTGKPWFITRYLIIVGLQILVAVLLMQAGWV